MIKPIAGMAFVIEDTRDDLKAAGSLKALGFEQSEAHINRTGVSGMIYAINETDLCAACGSKRKKSNLKIGDRVIFSKYIADQVDLQDENGERIKGLLSLPVDGILAIYES